MTTLKIEFLWEEDDGMSYDDMMEQLMHFGAYNIEEEVAEIPEAKPKITRQKKPLKP